MYIAFDIGGSSIKYGLVSSTGEIIEKTKIPTPEEESKFLSALTEIVTAFKEKHPEIKGIGISAPGIISKEGVMTTFGALREMYGLPLQSRLSDLTGLPVAIENDGNAAAIAERWLGAAQDLENYIVMVLGTGIGGGIVINGQTYRGAHGMAGELGWPLYHGITQSGNLELQSENFHSAVVTGLLRRYHSLSDPFSKEEFLADASIFLEKVKEKDSVAFPLFEDFMSDLALNLLNLFSIFDPEAILIGGGVSESDFFMEILEKKWSELIGRHEALNFVNQMKIVGEIRRTELGNDAGMLGAAYTIKTRLKD